jgi:hypothetical protein
LKEKGDETFINQRLNSSGYPSGYLLFIPVILNFVLFFLLAGNTIPIVEDVLWLTGSNCLLLFDCQHGWFRYGWTKLVIFFGLLSVISWSVESLSPHSTP